MADRIVYAICEDDGKFETMTKEDILAAIEQALETGHVADPEGAVFSRIKEIRAGQCKQLWVGTEAQFNALNPAPTYGNAVVRVGKNGVLYLCSDDALFEGIDGHIKDKNNPHNVTLEQVIGGDVVSLELGGTGAKTPADARSKLGITPANIGAAKASHTHTKSQISDFPTSMPASDVYAWAKAANKPTYTAAEVGAVKKSGDKMTGTLYVTNHLGIMGNNWRSLVFTDEKEAIRGEVQIGTDNQLVFNTYETGKSYGDRYHLPGYTAGKTADSWYEILTSKKAVTVAQGGTGATDAATARTRLGITPDNIGAAASGHTHNALHSGSNRIEFEAYTSDFLGLSLVGPYSADDDAQMALRFRLYKDTGIIGARVDSKAGTFYPQFYTTHNRPKPEDIGAVKNTGDTVRGTLHNRESYAYAIGTDDRPDAVVFMRVAESDANRAVFRQYGANGNRENFNLPNTTNPAANANYDILTTKSPVTVPQGGTGATTKKAARKNLGFEVQCGVVNDVGTSGVTVTFSEAFSGVPVVTATGGSEAASVYVRDITTTGFRLLSGVSNNDGVQWQAIYISN